MKKIGSFSSLINRRCSATAKTYLRRLSTKTSDGRDEWNDAWETAWLPEYLSAKNRAPWEADVNFSIADTPEALDPDTKAFVEDMSDNWEQRRKKVGSKSKRQEEEERLLKMKEEGKSLYSLENVKMDYRVMKQRVHAGLWVKEIEKMEEAKLGDSSGGAGDDLDRFLDSASEYSLPLSFSRLNLITGARVLFLVIIACFRIRICQQSMSKLRLVIRMKPSNIKHTSCFCRIFDSKPTDSSDLKNKPDGWETTSKAQDGNIWEMTQREEDILLQEYERRIAFSKFQVSTRLVY